MAQVRNLTADTLPVPHLGVTVGPGEVHTIPDEDIWPDGLAADSDEGLAYAAEHPDARNWRVPGVWQVEGDPPPVGQPAAAPETAPDPAPSE